MLGKIFLDINKIMAQSKDYDELLHYWHAWHEAIGPQLQNKYLRYVQLANLAAKLNGMKSFDFKYFISVRKST